MNKILFVVAALATFGFAATAEAKQDHAERAGWQQTVAGERAPAVFTPAPVVIEGRNAATTGTVDSYIERSVEQNARSK